MGRAIWDTPTRVLWEPLSADSVGVRDCEHPAHRWAGERVRDPAIWGTLTRCSGARVLEHWIARQNRWADVSSAGREPSVECCFHGEPGVTCVVVDGAGGSPLGNVDQDADRLECGMPLELSVVDRDAAGRVV